MADPVIDEIKARMDIADLVGQTVQLKKAGRLLKGLCPFHNEKTPSFVVYPDQGTYHCFGCGKGGDVFSWLQETEKLDFGEALKVLANRAGVTLPERTPKPPDPETVASTDALQSAAAWFHQLLLHTSEGASARSYLAKRGLTRATVERFQLGWAPDKWDALCQHLRKQGITPEQLEAAGLARRGDHGLHDLFRGRVMFPIRDADGKVCGFGGRILGDGQPKYLNSPQTKFFDKSATLYGLDLAKGAIRKDGCAVIVEGYMDVIGPHQAGIENVVASLGTALTEQQVALLRRLTGTIVLALDADAAGQAAMLRGLEVARQALAERRRPVPGMAARGGYLSTTSGQLKIAVLKGGKDPDEIVREDPQAWRDIIAGAVPMMEHKLAVELAGVDLKDPQSKLAAVQELARFLALVPDRIEWAHYVDVIAQRLRLDLAAVRDEVARAERAARAEQRRREQRAAESAHTMRAHPGPGEAPVASPAQGVPDAAPAPVRSGDQVAPPGVPVHSRSPVQEDAVEEHIVFLLAQAPHLARRMPARLAPEDFSRPEMREIYRVVVAGEDGHARHAGAPGEWPGNVTPGGAEAHAERNDSVHDRLDPATRPAYERLLERARRLPRESEIQMEADLAGVVRRLRERNLRRQLQEAQFLLAEAEQEAERQSLAHQVGRLAAQLGRVHLEQSRSALYTAPSA